MCFRLLYDRRFTFPLVKNMELKKQYTIYIAFTPSVRENVADCTIIGAFISYEQAEAACQTKYDLIKPLVIGENYGDKNAPLAPQHIYPFQKKITS